MSEQKCLKNNCKNSVYVKEDHIYLRKPDTFFPMHCLDCQKILIGMFMPLYIKRQRRFYKSVIKDAANISEKYSVTQTVY